MSLLRSASKTLFSAADFLGPAPKGPRILIYHQVGSDLGRQMEVEVDVFERQLDWLAATHEIVDLDTAVDRWAEADSDRLVVLTFDDGYADTFETAFPLLTERSAPFTLYLATESIESGVSLGPAEGAEPITWSMVGEMLQSGLVTVGAHTHTHRDLRSATKDQVEEEIATSNRLIEDRLGVEPRHFAYPWGYASPDAEQIIGEVYRTAVLGGSPRPPEHPSLTRLHRYPVQSSDRVGFFKARIRGGLRMEERVRRLIKGYDGP